MGKSTEVSCPEGLWSMEPIPLVTDAVVVLDGGEVHVSKVGFFRLKLVAEKLLCSSDIIAVLKCRISLVL